MEPTAGQQIPTVCVERANIPTLLLHIHINPLETKVRSILSAADAEELVGRDDYGNTLLILACQYRHKALVPLILARSGGALDLDAVNSEGACALHFACYKDSVCAETAFLLLERGATPEVIENTHG